MRTPRRCAGFTLLELLLVIALMGLATIVGGRMLMKVMQAWRTVQTRADLDQQAEAALDGIGHYLNDAASARLSGVGLRGIARTTTERVRVPGVELADDVLMIPVRTAVAPGSPPTGALIAYEVRAVPEGKNRGDKLVRTVGDLGDLKPIGGELPVIPRADVVAFRVEFAGADGKWLDASAPDYEGWFSEELPRAVRVSLTLVNPTRPAEQASRSRVFTIHVQ